MNLRSNGSENSTGMNTAEVTLLRESFVRLDRVELVECVLAQTFARQPMLIPPTPEDHAALRTLLQDELLRFAANVHHLLQIASALAALGARLAPFQISPDEFDLFAATLVDAVRTQQSAEWSESLEWTWTATTQAAACLAQGGFNNARMDYVRAAIAA